MARKSDRVLAAERVVKNMKNRGKEDLAGCFKESDDTVVISDGYVLYIGTPIEGVPEVKNPEKYFDYKSCVVTYTEIENKFSLNFKEIKNKYQLAKMKFPNKKKPLYVFDEGGRVVITNKDSEKVYFNAEYIINACELLGGTNFTIHVDRPVSPCVIEGLNGKCMVCPYRSNRY